MKNIFHVNLFIASLLTFNNLSAQTLQTYNGIYELSYPYMQNAKAMYTYYDDTKTYNRVKQGKFTLNFKGSGQYSPFEIIVIGNYKNNLKEGAWSYKLITTDLQSGELYESGTTTVTGNYKDGVPNGFWQSIFSSSSKEKKFNSSTHQWVFTTPTMPNSTKTSVKFNMGTAVGHFSYSAIDPNVNSTSSISVDLDSLGFINGKFIEKDAGSENIVEYSNGFPIKSVYRNLQSGEAKVKMLSEAYEDSIVKLINSKKIEPSEIPYRIEEREQIYSKEYKLIKDNFFDKTLLMLNDIKGEVNFNGDYYKIIAFRTRELIKQETTNDKFNQSIKSGDTNFDAGRLELAISNYNEAISIKPSEEKYLKEKIKQIEIKIEERFLSEKTKIGDDYFKRKNYQYALNSYNEALEVKSNDGYLKSQINECSRQLALTKLNEDYILLSKEINDKLYKIEINYFEFISLDKSFGPDHISSIKRQLKDQNFPENIIYVEKTEDVYVKIKPINNRKNIYSAYKILLYPLIEEIKKSQDISVQVEKSASVKKLLVKIIELASSSNTEELNESLKKIKDTENIKKLLLLTDL